MVRVFVRVSGHIFSETVKMCSKKGQLCWRHMMESDSHLHAATAQGVVKEAQQPKQATPLP